MIAALNALPPLGKRQSNVSGIQFPGSVLSEKKGNYKALRVILPERFFSVFFFFQRNNKMQIPLPSDYGLMIS